MTLPFPDSLQYEKLRWQELETELNKDLTRSIGDIFLSSAFITYLSMYSSDQRNVRYQHFFHIILKREFDLQVLFNPSRILLKYEE